MTQGIKALRQIQLNREATQGTAGTEYHIWRGVGTIEDVREVVWPDEDIGILPGTDRQYVPKTGGEIEFEETPATFEQMPHIFDAAFYNTTDTTDASAARVRTYTLPIQSSDAKVSSDLMTYTIRGGDNAEVECMHFAFVREFTLSGTAGEALNLSATWQGREVTTDTGFATTSTIPTVEEILFSKGKLYLDAIGGSYGGTEVSNTLLALEGTITTGWQAVETASGRTDFSFIKQVQPEIVFEITFEHNATAMAEKGYWRAGTARKMQLKFLGNALSDTDAGATYDTKALIINLTGKWEKFDKLDEEDGNDIVVGTFRARYDGTSATFAQFILVNEVGDLS